MLLVCLPGPPPYRRRRHLLLLLTLVSLRAAALQPTPAPAGPYHISSNRILDRTGHPYVMRGTDLATVTLETSRPGDLGALSASALVTIRQRLNMNAVRLPLIAADYERHPAYRSRVQEIVCTANRLDLLVILAPQPDDAPASFWTGLASTFRDNPNVFFAVEHAATAVTAIRAAHAHQPILANAAAYPIGNDPHIIYEATANYTSTRTGEDRWTQFGSLAIHVPVLVRGLDPHLDEDSAECAAFPADPAVATTVVQSNLTYFDAHNISWIISSFRPGGLISDTRYFNGTKLDDGWVCGKRSGMAGLGMVLLAHLWQSDPHGLFVVNGDSGGLLIARGGRATAYGPILADRQMDAKAGKNLTTILGNVSVRVTDSRGVTRIAPLLQTGGGWAYLNFVVPDNSAPGPAEVAIVRTDGSRSSARSLIADVAPGLLSITTDGRGPAKALVSQRVRESPVRTSVASKCSGYDCRTVPILLSPGTLSTLRLEGTGFRHARSNLEFQVMIGDVAVPVLSFGPVGGNPARDQLMVRLPDELIGYGETDLLVKVNGVSSNVVRINCGGGR